MSILVTGGAGFIGSHTCVELLERGKNIVVVDDFSNSKPSSLEAVKKITGKDFKIYNINYLDKKKLEKVFKENSIDSVINFAGFKAVGESVKEPLKYYINNINGMLNLLDVMKENNVKKIIFSSSATVYGESDIYEFNEKMPRGKTTNPYGTTKAMIEKILEDLYASDNTWDICILRYFNPVGAHKSGLLGEDPKGIPNNLMPYIQRVAAGSLKELSIFGNDYDTPDGTGVRDYIHVVDLAIGHVYALEKIDSVPSGLFVYNLGSGKGHSVLEMVETFQRVNDVKIPYKIVGRRDGDLACCYANTKKAKEELGFETKKTLDDICKDSWNYVKKTLKNEN